MTKDPMLNRMINDIAIQLGLKRINHHEYPIAMTEIKIRYKTLQKMMRVVQDKPRVRGIISYQMKKFMHLYDMMDRVLREE